MLDTDNVEYEIIDTRITDHWGVEWTPMEIVRDFLQNFYDANPIEDIQIKINKTTVIVSAPHEFDYKSLIYLGSDKGSSDIGQYGEGFKASTVNAMRNHGCKVKAQIKSDLLEFYFETEKIGESDKKIIKIRKSKVPKIKGTKLILENCSKEITNEFKFGLNYFYYEENPLFGSILTQHYSGDILIYNSIQKDVGYVFYKKLLRSKLDVPLVIVCNRTYKSIDAKIQHDRDRKAFNEDVLDLLLKYVLKQVKLHKIVKALKPWWQSGHKILRILSSGYGRRNLVFPENYYAKHSKRETKNRVMQIQVDQIEHEFQQKGYVQCPVYMGKLGMQNAVSIVRNRTKLLKEKHESLYTRDPTELEIQALNYLKNYIRNIDPLLNNRFAYASYKIGDSDELIGQLRAERSYRSTIVYLSKHFFLLDFPEALAILMHEWGHIYGFDGSRNFTDALTEFIMGIISNRQKLDTAEQGWKELSLKIRSTQFNRKLVSRMNAIINGLTSEQKSLLLKSIPEDELLKLIEKENIEIVYVEDEEHDFDGEDEKVDDFLLEMYRE